MPSPSKGARIGGSPAHQRLMLANLATSLFEHGKITTTEAKAKRLRPFAEKLITTAKSDSLHHRREILKVIRDKDVVHKLFAEIGPHFAERPGGYTRIVKTMPRKGDNAPMAVIQLVPEQTVASEASKARGTRFARDEQAGSSAALPASAEAADVVTETPEEEVAADPEAELSEAADEAQESTSDGEDASGSGAGSA